ncbi:hypothetical protein CONPUDRAFT_156774 [Coniophora puteana RWD-64-598 SS2]|uniref:Enhancer of polycomb-like N-terminal domain-containing protein n=1 Tax=Coniophora puteana (strain RWD-64-598) TaxID=741705 RepID=A0A5M3ME59_CONPW|nr:uncharacterized protein CONPUDRAFT_156774 [Coniophora puteana RWD-64-598 SS2]EIW77559.1 hypothetical protein CONPUDRAFT_156774 [Coniophora puteana RWD-64-598 SS2]
MENYVKIYPLRLYIELNIFDNIRHKLRWLRLFNIGLVFVLKEEPVVDSNLSQSASARPIPARRSLSPLRAPSTLQSINQGGDNSADIAIDQQLAHFLQIDCGVPLTKTAGAFTAFGISDMETFVAAVRKEDGEAFQDFIQQNGAQHGLTLWEIFILIRGVNKLRMDNDLSEFQQPDHCIRYIEPVEEDSAIQVDLEYGMDDMDEQDQEWLDALSAERKKEQLNPISYETFEVMDRLEKEWFDSSECYRFL